jgi:hypothetical protein
VPPCATLWHEAKKDAKPILSAQRLHKSSTHPAQPAFLPGAVFIPAGFYPFDNKAARRAALWLSLEPYFGFTTKSKPCLPLKNQAISHTTAALRIKQASTYAEKPGHFRQNHRPATKNTNPPYTQNRDRCWNNRCPAIKKANPPYSEKPDRFRQHRRPAEKTKPDLRPKPRPLPATPLPCDKNKPHLPLTDRADSRQYRHFPSQKTNPIFH